MPIITSSVHSVNADLENIHFRVIMYIMGSLALSHNIFKQNKISNGKFGKADILLQSTLPQG